MTTLIARALRIMIRLTGGDGSGDAVSGDEESMVVSYHTYASLFRWREGIGQKKGAQQI